MAKKSIYHFISEDESLERRLMARLGTCRSAWLASAFFTRGALRALRSTLAQALQSGARVTFLIGRYDFVTEPTAIADLLKLAAAYPRHLRVFFDVDYEFHFKLAVFGPRATNAIIIGSSNLTPKGLGMVGEVNLEIAGNATVYDQAKQVLVRRLQMALPAEKHLAEYRLKYRRAKKFRQYHHRWTRAGQMAWAPRRRKYTFARQPEGGQFTFCWIGEHETDRRLIAQIRRQEARAEERGESFVKQWVNYGPSNRSRLFEEGREFVVVDDISRNIGFAYCQRKIIALA